MLYQTICTPPAALFLLRVPPLLPSHRNRGPDWHTQLPPSLSPPPFYTPEPERNRRCAFFGHCDHKIEKIQEGHRLTLTYILRYDPADKGIADEMREGMGAAGAIPPVPSAGGKDWINTCGDRSASLPLLLDVCNLALNTTC